MFLLPFPSKRRKGSVIRGKILTVSAVVAGLAVPATAQAVPKDSIPAPLLEKIHKFVKKQHHWSYWSYGHRIRYGHAAERSNSLAFREWVKDTWKHRAHRAYMHYLAMSAYTRDWQCIGSHEGAWTSNTGNGYYGKFQADISFQSTYNPRAFAAYGTANNWPARDQIIMARRGYFARGYTPWPNTAAMCGLL